VSQAALAHTASRKATEEGTVHLALHYLSVELLRLAFFALKRDAAPGVDGLTWQDYEADLDRRRARAYFRALAVPVERRLGRSHRGAEGPADERCHHCVSQCGAPLSPI
jgi:hypothetical protein